MSVRWTQCRSSHLLFPLDERIGQDSYYKMLERDYGIKACQMKTICLQM
jgi:hypothetical protein